MTRITRMCILFIPIWLCMSAPGAAEPALCTPGNPLKVITYNVQFLPPPMGGQNERPEPTYRATRIAEEMSRHHIVGLQETFHSRHRKTILHNLREHWGGELHWFKSPRVGNHITNGGCLVCSPLAFVDTNAVIFETYSTSREYGLRADGWAAKGVIRARVAVNPAEPDKVIDVYVTHLEARADHLRPEQYKEMARFIGETSSRDHPFILMGDLNTNGNAEPRQDPESQYNVLMGRLRQARPDAEVVDVWLHLRPDELGGTTKQESVDIGKRIDYIIVGNPPTPAPRLRPIAVDVKLFRDPEVFALSDHNAVEASFVWEE